MIGSLVSARGRIHPGLTLTDELLGRIDVPTHFLWGADDPFGGEAVAHRVASAMGDAEVEMLPDAGHLPWLDDPVHAAGAVEAFLRSGSGTTSRELAAEGSP